MSQYIPNWLKPIPPPDMMEEGDYRHAYNVKTKFGMLGPVAAGKSTIAAAIVYTCQTLSSLVPNFYARVLPSSSHILADANNLRLGKFPEKTDPFTPKAPEAGLLIGETGGWKEKKIQVPICDVAGEISDYIQEKAAGFTPGQIIKHRGESINTQVVNTVKDCQGFLIALAANDALMFRESASTFDADVYTHTVMNEIFEYRRRHRRADPVIIVVLTKWDEVMTEAKDIQMDIYNEPGLGMARFLANGFPSTSMLLKPLRDRGKVYFFRSWFKIKRDEKGRPICWPNTDKKIIDVIEEENSFIRFKPAFDEKEYSNMVRLIGSFGR